MSTTAVHAVADLVEGRLKPGSARTRYSSTSLTSSSFSFASSLHPTMTSNGALPDLTHRVHARDDLVGVLARRVRIGPGALVAISDSACARRLSSSSYKRSLRAAAAEDLERREAVDHRAPPGREGGRERRRAPDRPERKQLVDAPAFQTCGSRWATRRTAVLDACLEDEPVALRGRHPALTRARRIRPRGRSSSRQRARSGNRVAVSTPPSDGGEQRWASTARGLPDLAKQRGESEGGRPSAFARPAIARSARAAARPSGTPSCRRSPRRSRSRVGADRARRRTSAPSRSGGTARGGPSMSATSAATPSRASSEVLEAGLEGVGRPGPGDRLASASGPPPRRRSARRRVGATRNRGHLAHASSADGPVDGTAAWAARFRRPWSARGVGPVARRLAARTWYAARRLTEAALATCPRRPEAAP